MSQDVQPSSDLVNSFRPPDEPAELATSNHLPTEQEVEMEEQVEEVEEPPPKQLESMVLAVAHHWSRRETKDRQVELIERHFRKDEMFNALLALNKLVGRKGPQNRQATSARTAAKAQAEDVVNAIVELGDQAKLPRFLVQSEDLHRVLPLLGALAVSDERTVAVRLEALEAAQRNNMVEMRRLVASTMAGVPTAHQWSAQAAHLISAPGAPERSAPGAPERSALGAPLPVPSLVVTKPDYATAAGAGGQVGGGGAGRSLPPLDQQFHERPTRAELEQQERVARAERGDRVSTGRGKVERSLSRKRQRTGSGEGDFVPVNHQRRGRKERPKVSTGTSSLAELADLAGPAEFWIGNTRADTTKEQVLEKLMRSAEELSTTLKVEQVVCLTKEVNPRTRSWKVSVVASSKELMANPVLYPVGWTFRPFKMGPRRPQTPLTSQGSSPVREGAAGGEV